MFKTVLKDHTAYHDEECECENEDKDCECEEEKTEIKQTNEKMKKDYNYRNNTTLSIKDVDTVSRTVAGYFASFDNVDSDGDLIKKGAFLKSINDNGPQSKSNRQIAHLAQHDVKKPIGVIQVLKEDSNGLYFESKIGKHTDGEDALQMYLSGIIKEHSIGFQYIESKTNWIDIEDNKSVNTTAEGNNFISKNNGYNEISEVKLWEGSYVTFGSNSETPSFGVIKGQDKTILINDINNRMILLRKELSNGKYSDNGFKILCQELAYIQESYNALLKSQPVVKTTEKDKAAELKEFLLYTLPNK